jgi:hypothetical protein
MINDLHGLICKPLSLTDACLTSKVAKVSC